MKIKSEKITLYKLYQFNKWLNYIKYFIEKKVTEALIKIDLDIIISIK